MSKWIITRLSDRYIHSYWAKFTMWHPIATLISIETILYHPKSPNHLVGLQDAGQWRMRRLFMYCMGEMQVQVFIPFLENNEFSNPVCISARNVFLWASRYMRIVRDKSCIFHLTKCKEIMILNACKTYDMIGVMKK